MADLSLPAGLSIRPQRDGDALFLTRLFNSTRDDLRLIEGEADFIEGLIELQFRAQREGYGTQFPNAMYYVVEWHGEAIGRAAVDFGHNEVRLIDLAFLPQARGRGLGSQVIRALQQAADKVRTPLTLTVLRNNPRAIQLYAALGFGLLGESPSHLLLGWYPPAAVAMPVA